MLISSFPFNIYGHACPGPSKHTTHEGNYMQFGKDIKKIKSLFSDLSQNIKNMPMNSNNIANPIKSIQS